MPKVHIIGVGLAGSEAAWQLAQRGIKVKISEMKPQKFSPAHKSPYYAELVCSNSLRSDDACHNAVGLLHEEMRRADSLIMNSADANKVPAGGALAVDREKFAAEITQKLRSHENIEIVSEEICALPDKNEDITIIATGPLTSEMLLKNLQEKIGGQYLSFYDAIAPVVFKESIDMNKAWYQSRYDKGDGKDYINCPLNKKEYDNFVDALLSAPQAEFHEFEKESFFDGCLPIEVMAQRGRETLAFGPMKPIGLQNPHKSEKPYAVVQLRQDNKEDTLRNIVGFQTKLKHGAQAEVFRLIPGLEHAEFARFGGIHKNTFINSPVLLDSYLRLKAQPELMFAGQITGCEGYVESASIGLLAGLFACALVQGKTPILPPRETAFGSMLAHLSDIKADFQPMNINFGLFPNLEPVETKTGKKRWLKGAERKEAYAKRALENLDIWLEKIRP